MRKPRPARDGEPNSAAARYDSPTGAAERGLRAGVGLERSLSFAIGWLRASRREPRARRRVKERAALVAPPP